MRLPHDADCFCIFIFSFGRSSVPSLKCWQQEKIKIWFLNLQLKMHDCRNACRRARWFCNSQPSGIPGSLTLCVADELWQQLHHFQIKGKHNPAESSAQATNTALGEEEDSEVLKTLKPFEEQLLPNWQGATLFVASVTSQTVFSLPNRLWEVPSLPAHHLLSRKKHCSFKAAAPASVGRRPLPGMPPVKGRPKFALVPSRGPAMCSLKPHQCQSQFTMCWCDDLFD